MREIKKRIQGFSQRIKALFQPYLSEDIIDAYQPGLDILIRALKDGGDYMANDMKMAKGQGEMETNEFGGKRESNKGRGAFYLIPYEAIEELAIWYEQGAEKYGDRNWEKGMSVKDCINRMMRHAFKASNGWMDEGPFAHLVAVIWNAIAAIVMIKRYPDRNDFWPERYKKYFIPKESYIEDYGMAKCPEEKSKEGVSSLLSEIEHYLDELGYETRQPIPKWEHDKKRILTDKATAIRVRDIDRRLIFVLDFDSQEDLNEFRDNVAKMGIESTTK